MHECKHTYCSKSYSMYISARKHICMYVLLCVLYCKHIICMCISVSKYTMKVITMRNSTGRQYTIHREYAYTYHHVFSVIFLCILLLLYVV